MQKIGLIGCRYMGSVHASCYKEIEGDRIVAVADTDMEKAEEIAKVHGAEIYTSGMDLIENADVDVIDICLPTYLHTSHAVAAMKKGRNVFIEKPVCMTKEDGDLLLKVQKETGAKVQVGQVVRSWDEYAWLKETADKKIYGEIQSAVFKRISAVPRWSSKNWLHDAGKSGSVALDFHIHDVDYMRYLMGEPDGFTTRALRNEHGIMEEIFTSFTYGNAVVTVEGGWDYPADFPFEMEFRVKFEKAAVVFNSQGLAVYPNEGGQINPKIKRLFESESNIGGNLSSFGGFYNELKSFVDNLNAGKEITVAPLDEGVKSVRLILDIVESAGGLYN